jgi:hypothetical protein
MTLTLLRTLALAACLAGLAVCTGAFAQPNDAPEIDPRDEPVPPPPAFSKDKLLALDMPVFMSLKFGIDPASISISPAKTVRYVLVATSASGAANVMYEGLRCEAGDFITYARQLPDGKWNLVKNPVWRPLNDINTARHALAFARQGACEGRNATASSVADIVRALKAR